jgi:hypothetical protein
MSSDQTVLTSSNDATRLANDLGAMSDLHMQYAQALGLQDSAQIAAAGQALAAAAADGNHWAGMELAKAREEGSWGYEKDEFAALDMLERLAEQERFGPAFGQLAMMYVERKSHAKGMRLAEEGSRLDDALSCYVLGHCHEGFDGGAEDPLSACRSFKRAIDLCQTQGTRQYNVKLTLGLATLAYARCLFWGRGVQADQPKAVALLEAQLDNQSLSRLYVLENLIDFLERAQLAVPNHAQRLEQWRAEALRLGSGKMQAQERERQRDEAWKKVSHFTVDGVAFECFVTRATLVNKRVERHTSISTTGGYGRNNPVRVQSHHSSWQVLTFRSDSNADHTFEVTPDKALSLSNGTPCAVVYLQREGAQWGYPVRIVDRQDGQAFVAQADVFGKKQLNLAAFRRASIAWFIAGVPILALWMFARGGMLAFLVGAALVATGVVRHKNRNGRIKALNQYLGAVCDFLR